MKEGYNYDLCAVTESFYNPDSTQFINLLRENRHKCTEEFNDDILSTMRNLTDDF